MITEFIDKYKLGINHLNSDEILDIYLSEIKKGLSKYNTIEECSIPMLPTYINLDINVNSNKYILVDAGGTNFRSCIGKLDNNELIIEDFEKTEMPASKVTLSKNEFFSKFASNIKRLETKANDIGLCFSYQLKMQNNLDGKLLAWAKEIKAPEVVGSQIGKEILEKLDNKKRKIAITNDTIAVLLGSYRDDLTCDKYIGCIFGTGFNVCYLEDVKNIKKINDALDNDMLINTETGNFKGFPMGEIDKELNSESNLPKEALAEKQISGIYLPIIITKAIKRAISEGFLKEEKSFDSFDMIDVSNYFNSTGKIKEVFGESVDLKELILSILKRAAYEAAITLSAFAIQSNASKVGICLEGTTIYKTPNLLEYLNQFLKEILSKKGIDYTIIDGRDKILKGALISIMKK